MMDPAVIEYRLISGFSDYRVGDDGSVWSCKTGEWVQIFGRLDRDGYQRFVLFRRGVRHERYGHHLVLFAFVGPMPVGREACHGPDRRRSNNRLTNLRWGTRKENRTDTAHDGLLMGSKHGMAKLTEADIPCIRQLILDGDPKTHIARRYFVSASTIHAIDRGITWQHVI